MAKTPKGRSFESPTGSQYYLRRCKRPRLYLSKMVGSPSATVHVSIHPRWISFLRFAQLPDLSGVIHRPPFGWQLTGKKLDSFIPPTGSNRLANSYNPEFIDAHRVVESYPAVTATPRRGPTAKPVVLYYACRSGFIGICGWVEKILVFLWWLFGK